jgi:hypothetical protein
MSRIDTLKDLLIDCLIEDLMDPERRSPGLYQAASRVIADNKEQQSQLPSVGAETLEKLVPFKFKAS